MTAKRKMSGPYFQQACELQDTNVKVAKLELADPNRERAERVQEARMLISRAAAILFEVS